MLLVTSKAHTLSVSCMVFYLNIHRWMLLLFITHTDNYPTPQLATRMQHSKRSSVTHLPACSGTQQLF